MNLSVGELLGLSDDSYDDLDPNIRDNKVIKVWLNEDEITSSRKLISSSRYVIEDEDGEIIAEADTYEEAKSVGGARIVDTKNVSQSRRLNSSYRYDDYDWGAFYDNEGYPNSDLIDECIRVVEWYNQEEPEYNENFDRYYQKRIDKGLNKKEAHRQSARNAIVDVCGDVENFRRMLDSYRTSLGDYNVVDAIDFANYPPEEDERTPDERWEDYVYSKEVRSSRKLIKQSVENAVKETEKYFGTIAENHTVTCQNIITEHDRNQIKKIAEENNVNVKIGLYSVRFYD